VSSRDGSDRTGGRPRSSQSDRGSNQQANWDVDPAEIDRYLSGRPTRQQESQARSGRNPQRQPQDVQGTASQLEQLERARREQSRQTPQQYTSRQPAAGRQQFVDPVYEDDDLYETYDDYADDVQAYDEDAYRPQATGRQPREQQARQPQRQPSRPRQQRQESRQVRYDDEFDDELYADDPYLTYDDSADWDTPGTNRPTRARPQVKLAKPNLNLPKFTMPTSISQSELVNDIPSLSMIGGAILSAAVMAILVSNRLVDVLPDIIPTHVSASGVQENLKGRNALWSIPLAVTAMSLMNLAAAWFVARIDMFAARFILAAALIVQFVAWVAVLRYLWP